jgi:hypothetical protein
MSTLRQSDRIGGQPKSMKAPSAERSGQPRHMFCSTQEPMSSLVASSSGDFNLVDSIDDLLDPQELQTYGGGQDAISLSPYSRRAATSLPSYAWSLHFNHSCEEKQGSTSTTRTSTSCSDGSETPGCLRLGVRTLRSLYSPSHAYMCIFNENFDPSLQQPQPRMMDALLTVCRGAMDTFARLLDCRCLAEPAVQMVAVVICERLVAWHQAILRAGAHKASGIASAPDIGHEGLSAMYGESGVAAASEHDEEEPTERVERQPIRVGGFELGDGMSDRVIACIVLCELERVESLVNRLASLGADGPFKKPVHGSLVDLLRRRLLAAKTAALRRASP